VATGDRATKEQLLCNPVYVAWRHINKEKDGEAEECSYYNSVVSHERWLKGWMVRGQMVHISWSVPSPRAISSILQYLPHGQRNLVDLACGTGYWSMLFQQHGADRVTAVDDFSDAGSPRRTQCFFPGIVALDCVSYLREQAGRKDDHALFFSWPRSSQMMIDCLAHWNGTWVFVVGEGDGGCTGSLYTHVEAHPDLWELVDQLPIPRWQGIRDSLYVYRRTSCSLIPPNT